MTARSTASGDCGVVASKPLLSLGSDMNYASSRLVPGASCSRAFSSPPAGAGAAPICAINFQNYAPARPLAWFGSQAGPARPPSRTSARQHGRPRPRQHGRRDLLNYRSPFGASTTCTSTSTLPGRRRLTALHLFGSGVLQSRKKSGCGEIRAPGRSQESSARERDLRDAAGDRWSADHAPMHVAAPRSFDVLVTGAATGCTAVPTQLGTPFRGIGIMDASNVGVGR